LPSTDPAASGKLKGNKMKISRQAQHTDGPWVVFPAPGLDIGSTSWGFVASCTLRPSPEEMKANAALIAAAPDLLAALEQCLPILDAHRRAALGEGDLTARTARAAIAKARDTE